MNNEMYQLHKNRVAEFIFEGHNISMYNPHFDEENPDKIISIGNYVKVGEHLQKEKVKLDEVLKV